MTTPGCLDIIEVAGSWGADTGDRKKTEHGAPGMNSDHPWRHISMLAAPRIVKDEWKGGKT